MKIKLCKDYRITTSTLNYVLEKRIPEYENKKCETVKEKWAVDGYYSSVKSLLKGYFNKQTLNSDAESIDELIKAINKVEETIGNFKEME